MHPIGCHCNGQECLYYETVSIYVKCMTMPVCVCVYAHMHAYTHIHMYVRTCTFVCSLFHSFENFDKHTSLREHPYIGMTCYDSDSLTNHVLQMSGH